MRFFTTLIISLYATLDALKKLFLMEKNLQKVLVKSNYFYNRLIRQSAYAPLAWFGQVSRQNKQGTALCHAGLGWQIHNDKITHELIYFYKQGKIHHAA
jgi:hypothetical protein